MVLSFRQASALFLGMIALVPCLLFSVGILSPTYFIAAFCVALYLCILVLNFEAGFLTLILIRSSLDYLKRFTGNGGLSLSAAVGVVLILLGIFYILYRKIRIFDYEETFPFLLFLVFCGISVFFSDSKLDSIQDWTRLFSVYFVYVFARHICVTRKAMNLVLLVVLYSSLAPVFVTFLQLVTHTGYGHGRFAGTFYHPNAFASYLLVILVFCVAQMLEKDAMLPKVIITPLVAALFFALVLTFSRGAWIVFIFVMGLMSMIRYRRLMIFLPLVLILAIFLVPSVKDRVNDVFDGSMRRGRSAWQWRLDAWAAIRPLMFQRPLFGHGLSTIEKKLGYMAHNDYLRLIVETGIAGLLSYLYLVGHLLKRAWKDYQIAKTPLTQSFQLGIFALMTGFLVREVADNTLRNTAALTYFWIFIALSRNMTALEKRGEA